MRSTATCHETLSMLSKVCRTARELCPDCGSVPRVPGRAHPAVVRLLGIAAAALLVAVLPAYSQPNPVSTTSALRLQNAHLEARARSAVLDLYSLDSRLAAARARLASLQVRLQDLREQRAVLRHELRIARAGKRISEQQLASRLRQLYDQGEVSPLEVVFGANSISDAMAQLDNINRVASLNDDVLVQLRSARPRLLSTAQTLALRTAQLEHAVRAAAATEAS